jgi:voltage-gated sodium channel
MQLIAKAIADSPRFQNTITALIVLAGVLVGLETYPSIEHAWGVYLHLADKIVLGAFILEIVVKVAAEGRKPWRYFFDPWNVFDFVIVAAALMPFAGSAATVLRLLRLLRVLKLVRALPKLQLLVSALLKSIPSMGYVSILLGLLFYVYAVAAVFMWGQNDPVHFGTLQTSMLSLFRTVTLEDWTDLMYINMFGCDAYGYDGMPALCTAPSSSPLMAALFFISFVLIGTMIILNLFIGVIMKGMDEAQAEQAAYDRSQAEERGDKRAPSLGDTLAALHAQLGDIQAQIATLAAEASRDEPRQSEVPAAPPSMPELAPAE